MELAPPSSWTIASIQDLAEYVQRGKSPKYTTKSDLPVINQKCVRWAGINPEFVKFIHEDQFPKWDQVRRLQKGDLLWNSTGTGTIGRACLYKNEFAQAVVDSHITIVRSNRNILEPGFLHYFIMSPFVQENFEDMQSGSTNQVELSKSAILEKELPLAPLNEQRRIVEKIDKLFSELDKGEEALRDVQKLLARYRQSVLKAAVTGELNNSTPTNWASVNLGSLLTDIRYGTAKKCSYERGNTAVLRIPNVVSGKIDLTDLKFTDLQEKEINKLSLKKGDLLIVRSNGSANLVARGAVVGADAEGLSYAGYLIRLRVDQTKLLPKFLHLILNSPNLRARIERNAKSTSGVHNINSVEVKAISFLLPSIEEQDAILASADEHMSKINQMEIWCQTELSRSKALRQSILKDAFSGRLVPQDESDEPAAKLLARIKQTRASAPKKTKRKASA